MSLANIAAIGVYALVTCTCLAAALAGALTPQPVRQPRRWLLCAGFFALLSLVRLFEVEERVRETLRTLSRAIGEYEDRWLVQVPLVAVTLLLGLVLLIVIWRAWLNSKDKWSDRLVLLGTMAMLGFAPLYALRIISLHQLDRILYGGAFRLNWILDLGLAMLAAVSALLYVRQCRRVSRGTDGDLI